MRQLFAVGHIPSKRQQLERAARLAREIYEWKPDHTSEIAKVRAEIELERFAEVHGNGERDA